MAPRLNLLSKKLFLEHMLYYGEEEKLQPFLRTLFISKRFLSIANSRRVYKLYITPYSNTGIQVAFGNYEKRLTYYTFMVFESTYYSLKLLKPQLVQFNYRFFDKPFTLNDLLTLMDIAGGKIGLQVEKERHLDILGKLWQRLDELKCPAELLKGIENVRLTPFDKLEISGICKIEELNVVLKHPSEQLDLKLSLWRNSNNDNVELHQNCAKTCKVCFDTCPYNISSFIQKIINACKQLKELEIDDTYSVYRRTFDDTLLNKISYGHQFLVELVKTIRQSSFNLKLKINFTFCCKIESTFPEDWKEQVKQICGLEDAEVREESYLNQEFDVKPLLKINGRFMGAPFCCGYRCFGSQYSINSDKECSVCYGMCSESESELEEENEHVENSLDVYYNGSVRKHRFVD